MTRLLAALALGMTLLAAQQPERIPLSYYLPAGTAYDTAVPPPEAFFGFQPGSWHLHPARIHEYARTLGRTSGRVTVLPMGSSYEQNEIVLMVITSPRNHARLEEIRREHLALSEPGASGGLQVDAMPVVVWMGYSVHGNEASGSNAAVLVAYHLAAARTPEIDHLLDNAVVLLNPSINPDGLARFATWVNAARGAVVDPTPQSREHQEPWPGGRTNHYWFDLNRDWMPVQHPESRARIAQYYAWRPNVLTDHHEMGTNATFFFQPGVPSRNNPLVPDRVGQLTTAIARFHARALDSIGSLYYTEESFDDFYVGKGSTYPDITGGIGILFEQASARGHAQEARSGVLTFPFAVRNQVTTSFSTLRAAVHHRRALLEHQRDMASSALALAEKQPVRAYVFGAADDHARADALAEVLVRHQIAVHRLQRDVTTGGRTYAAGHAYVVPTRQAQYRLLLSLFERRTSFTDSLFYDVSAWSLPLAMGIPYAELSSLAGNAIGDRVTEPPFRAAPPPPDGPGVAWAFGWNSLHAPRALHRLLAASVPVRVALEPFTGETPEGRVDMPAGSIVIPAGPAEGERSRILGHLRTIAAEDGIPSVMIVSGLTEKGIDLGSPSMPPLERPVVALAAGAGVSSNDAGEVWHLLDARLGMPVTLLDPEDLGDAVVDRYTVLILPAGTYARLDSAKLDRLRAWVQKGHTLVVLEQAVEWAVRSKLARFDLTRRSDRHTDSLASVLYGEEDRYRGARNVPGAIVRARADLTHPLLFGFGQPEVHLFKSTSVSIVASGRKALTPLTYDRNPLVSGYLHRDYAALIGGEAALGVTPLGRGHVILIPDNPVFRAYWHGTARLLTNSVFFGRLLQVPSGTD